VGKGHRSILGCEERNWNDQTNQRGGSRHIKGQKGLAVKGKKTAYVVSPHWKKRIPSPGRGLAEHSVHGSQGGGGKTGSGKKGGVFSLRSIIKKKEKKAAIAKNRREKRREKERYSLFWLRRVFII